MKKIIIALSFITLMAGATSNTYGLVPKIKITKNNDSLRDKPKKMIDSKLELRKPQANQKQEYQKFMNDSKTIISMNEKRLTEFKVMLSKLNQSDKETINRVVSNLEQKNKDLKTQLTNFNKNERHLEWASFKVKFNHDLSILDNQMWNIN